MGGRIGRREGVVTRTVIDGFVTVRSLCFTASDSKDIGGLERRDVSEIRSCLWNCVNSRVMPGFGHEYLVNGVLVR